MAVSPAQQRLDPAQHPSVTEREAGNRHKGYIPTLDGWRAIAILWVLFAHFDHGRRWLPIYTLIHAGEDGVQIFFALSGYLICTRLLHEEKSFGSISLKSFYTRRAFRIQPVVVCYLTVLTLLSLLGCMQWFWQGVVGSLLMIRNLWPGATVHSFNYTSNLWSLAVEEHFYLLLPGFLVLVRKRRLEILAVAAVALQIWRITVYAHPALQHFGWLIYLRTDLIIGNILLGAVFAVAVDRTDFRGTCKRYLQPWVALLYFACVVIFFNLHLERFHYQAIITTYPLLIGATLLHPQTRVGRFLEWAPMRFIGRISYSLYIWQELYMWPREWAPDNWIHRHAWLALAATFVTAWASYHIVEKPMQRVGHRISKRWEHLRKPREQAAHASAV